MKEKKKVLGNRESQNFKEKKDTNWGKKKQEKKVRSIVGNKQKKKQRKKKHGFSCNSDFQDLTKSLS